ncbi:MAG: NTP transferase domain-containing protein [Ignisphaera sp.]
MVDAVVMAGGRGSRLGGVKKQLLEVCGRRLIDVALTAAKEINSSKIRVCIKKEDAPLVGIIEDPKIEVILCPGLGYVEDLNYILSSSNFPVIVLPADMPFLTSNVLKKFLDLAQKETADVVTLMVCKNGNCRESGISFFRRAGGSWVNVYFEEHPELRDIDTVDDMKWAESLCDSMEGIGKQR